MRMMLVYYRKNNAEYVSEMVSGAEDIFSILEGKYYQRAGLTDIDRYRVYRIKNAVEFIPVDCTYVPGHALILTENGWATDQYIVAEWR